MFLFVSTSLLLKEADFLSSHPNNDLSYWKIASDALPVMRFVASVTTVDLDSIFDKNVSFIDLRGSTLVETALDNTA